MIAIITSLAPTIAIIISALLNWLLAKEAERRTSGNTTRLDSIHTIVNNQRTEMVAQIAYLKVQVETLTHVIAAGTQAPSPSSTSSPSPDPPQGDATAPPSP